MSAAEVMSASKPKAQLPLTESQLKEFRIASNHVSLGSIRYAAEIVGYTDLVTATITTLEKLVDGSTSISDCRVLHKQATKATFRDEPLLDSILIALKWASSEGKGEFMVGNIVDPVYAVKTKAGEPNPDEETRKNRKKFAVDISAHISSN